MSADILQPAQPSDKASAFFDDLWLEGDPWELETSEFEQARYGSLLTAIGDRRYARALEIGCGAGAFSRRVAFLCGELLALDVSERAIDLARGRSGSFANVRYAVGDALKSDAVDAGPWDLVILSETIYYLGWLHPFFDVAWFASRLCASTSAGGRLLLANTRGDTGDFLMLGFIVDSYHALFVNAGFEIEAEKLFRGTKNGVDLEVLISVMAPRRAAPRS